MWNGSLVAPSGVQLGKVAIICPAFMGAMTAGPIEVAKRVVDQSGRPKHIVAEASRAAGFVPSEALLDVRASEPTTSAHVIIVKSRRAFSLRTPQARKCEWPSSTINIFCDPFFQ